MKQQKSNLSRAYLEHCGAIEACDIMIEVRDKMIDKLQQDKKQMFELVERMWADNIGRDCESAYVRVMEALRANANVTGLAPAQETTK